MLQFSTASSTHVTANSVLSNEILASTKRIAAHCLRVVVRSILLMMMGMTASWGQATTTCDLNMGPGGTYGSPEAALAAASAYFGYPISQSDEALICRGQFISARWVLGQPQQYDSVTRWPFSEEAVRGICAVGADGKAHLVSTQNVIVEVYVVASCTAPPPPPPCPVAPLTPITDAVALQHENGPYRGNPDLEHVTAATSTGAACIRQAVAALNGAATVTSGFRPPAYQTHLREVWDKWQLLKNNTTEACRVIKVDVRTHWDFHGMVRQPGQTSNHSLGTAVDMGGVPADSADTIATQCTMNRPLADDPVHYQPR